MPAPHDPARPHPTLSRRRLLSSTARATMGITVGGAAATLLAACGSDDGGNAAGTPTGTLTTPTPTPDEARAIVGDVLDFGLTSDEWAGAFGWVTLRLHRAALDGADATYICTDASDEAFAVAEGLVFVPRLRALADADLTGALYRVAGGTPDQPTVLTSAPDRDDYTPAWRVHDVTWRATPRPLRSVDEVAAAEAAGEVEVAATDVIVNAPVVTWPGGSLPVDDERTGYLGPGQLLDAPDLDGMSVRFKLHECFPGSRYIVVDTSAPPMASGMRIAASPRLHDASAAGATGRVNVFMNGVPGPGPMGFQPSIFDTRAGDPVWSPYWDHLTYAWRDEAGARVLEDEAALHAARDGGELDEFVGTPDTGGQGFVVNCPVPVLAPSSFGA